MFIDRSNLGGKPETIYPSSCEPRRDFLSQSNGRHYPKAHTKGAKQGDGKDGDHSPIIPPYDDGSPRTNHVTEDRLGKNECLVIPQQGTGWRKERETCNESGDKRNDDLDETDLV